MDITISSAGREIAGRLRSVLLLCDDDPNAAATVRDHIQSFERYSRFTYHRLSMLGDIPPLIDLSRFDAVVIHYSLIACQRRYLSASAVERIREFRGLKCLHIQDEYRFVNESIAAMRHLGIHVLFTCVPPGEIERVYPEEALPGVVKVNVLTGYVPENLLLHAKAGLKPPAERAIDVGYRGRYLPPWLGELGQEKWMIGLRFREDAKRYGLKTDISFREEDRLYGQAWIDFLENCKAVLGTESGASVVDFSGDIQRAVEADLARDPSLSFSTLRERHFADADGRVDLRQISPRCFECAALGTVMILYEGRYSGRLEPWRHYLPLRKDHGNMAEIAEILRDDAKLAEIAQTAFREVALAPSNSYRAFVAQVDAAMAAAFRVEMASSGPAYEIGEVARIGARNWTTVRTRSLRRIATLAYIGLFRILLGHLQPETREKIHRHIRRLRYYVKAGMARCRHGQ